MNCPKLLLFLFFCYTDADYDVTVTVESPICLDMYYHKLWDNETSSQLFVDLFICSGDKRSISYYYVSPLKPAKNYALINFNNSYNTFFGSSAKLELDTGISLSNLLIADELKVVFDINPMIIPNTGEPFPKCDPWDRTQVASFDPHITLNRSETRFTLTDTLSFNTTSCLNTTHSYSKSNCDPKIMIKLEFTCDINCDKLITTTPLLTTTSTTTTLTTSTSTSTTRTTTAADDKQTDSLVIPMAVVAVLASLELLLLIGIAAYCLRKWKPILFKRRTESTTPATKTAVHDNEGCYYDVEDIALEPTSSHQLPTNQPELADDYAQVELVDDHEYSATRKVTTATKTAKSPGVWPRPSARPTVPNENLSSNIQGGAFANNQAYG